MGAGLAGIHLCTLYTYSVIQRYESRGSWQLARGNLHQHRGELAPGVSYFFFVLQGGVQELRMEQPCGPLLYVPGTFKKKIVISLNLSSFSVVESYFIIVHRRISP